MSSQRVCAGAPITRAVLPRREYLFPPSSSRTRCTVAAPALREYVFRLYRSNFDVSLSPTFAQRRRAGKFSNIATNGTANFETLRAARSTRATRTVHVIALRYVRRTGVQGTPARVAREHRSARSRRPRCVESRHPKRAGVSRESGRLRRVVNRDRPSSKAPRRSASRESTVPSAGALDEKQA